VVFFINPKQLDRMPSALTGGRLRFPGGSIGGRQFKETRCASCGNLKTDAGSLYTSRLIGFDFAPACQISYNQGSFFARFVQTSK
jgi:hypothetical protein